MPPANPAEDAIVVLGGFLGITALLAIFLYVGLH